jgi:hypothetical protein
VIEPARWRRPALAAAALASTEAAAFYAYWWIRVIAGGLRGPDFFSFYAAARIFDERAPRDVYDAALQHAFQESVLGASPSEPHILLPYIHPPYYTILIAPLGLLTYPSAYAVMAGANLALSAATVAILARHVGLDGRRTLLLAALLAGYFPLFVTLLQGQSDLVMLAPLTAAFAAWSAGREATAGALAALATVKPQLLLLVPVLFLVRGSWRAVAAYVGVALVLATASVAVFGVDGIASYLRVVLPWLAGGAQNFPITGQSVYSLRGFLEGLPGGHSTALGILAALLVLTAALLTVTRPGRELEFAAAVAVSLALSPYQNLHDLLLLALPAFVLVRDTSWMTLVVAAAALAIDLTLLTSTLPAALAVLAIAAVAVVQTSMKSRLRQAR